MARSLCQALCYVLVTHDCPFQRGEAEVTRVHMGQDQLQDMKLGSRGAGIQTMVCLSPQPTPFLPLRPATPSELCSS